MTTEGQRSPALSTPPLEGAPPTLSAEERDLIETVLGKDRKATAEFVALHRRHLWLPCASGWRRVQTSSMTSSRTCLSLPAGS